VNEKQEPKYRIETHGGEREPQIVNRKTDDAIPDDEPVFILRARDRLAIEAMRAYFKEADDDLDTPTEHCQAIYARLKDFSDFRKNNPSRMKTPDT
jgi:hypothetical protein